MPCHKNNLKIHYINWDKIYFDYNLSIAEYFLVFIFKNSKYFQSFVANVDIYSTIFLHVNISILNISLIWNLFLKPSNSKQEYDDPIFLNVAK